MTSVFWVFLCPQNRRLFFCQLIEKGLFMCGFVGAFDLNSGSQPIDEGLKEQLRSQVLDMSKKIRHRGPDWSGV